MIADSKPAVFAAENSAEPQSVPTDTTDSAATISAVAAPAEASNATADLAPEFETEAMADEEALEADEEDQAAVELGDTSSESQVSPTSAPPQTKPIVFVVDDDADVRRVLSVLIKAMDLEVRDFASAAAFLDAFDPQQAGCLLVDVRMPGMSGIELLDELASRSITLPVIMISGHGDVPMAVRVMKAGAVAFLEKPFRDHELWESIQQAIRLDGERRRDLGWRNEVKQRIGRLTPLEREVMDLIVIGESNKSMALRLGVSVRTVEVRRAKVMRKMRVGNMADLIRSALAVNADCVKPQS